jgi:hypothetical protein
MDNARNSQSDMAGRKARLKKFFHIFLPIALLLLVLSAFFYQRESSASRERITSREMFSLENRRVTVANLLKAVVSDLRILTALQEMQALPEGASAEAAAALAAEFLTFSTSRGCYKQISFIDRQGMEIIRVDSHNANAAIAPPQELQLLSNSPLFRDTYRLQAGEFFMSRFTLEMEKGKIAYPQTPLICFGMPVFDRDGRKKGVVLVNYLGDQLLQTLKSPQEENRQSIYLLDSEGYWLLGPSPQVEWGFLYPDRKAQTVKTRFPAAWEEICPGESGYYADISGIYIFITLYPQFSVLNPAKEYRNARSCGCSADRDKYYWKIVSYIPAEISGAASPFILLRRLLFADGLLLLLFGALSWLLADRRPSTAT